MMPKVGDIIIRRIGTHKGLSKGDVCEIKSIEYNVNFGYLIDVKRLHDKKVVTQALYDYFDPYVLVEYEDVVNEI